MASDALERGMRAAFLARRYMRIAADARDVQFRMDVAEIQVRSLREKLKALPPSSECDSRNVWRQDLEALEREINRYAQGMKRLKFQLAEVDAAAGY